MNTPSSSFSDGDLMMFADGEASAELAEKLTIAMQTDAILARRVGALQTQVADVQSALDLDLLGAPPMPEHLLEAAPKPRRYAVPLAVAASFALGMVAMTILQPKSNWVDQVASYQALYVKETLAGGLQDPALTQAVLGQMQQKIGIDLKAIPELDGMTFKRAQMLAIDDAPLAQIAYLADDGTPFALCIMRIGGPDQITEHIQSHDLSATTWSKNGVGYVLIGGSDAARVSEIATDLHTKI
ncbi:anti-sigma factor family protein [Phaeobacter sp. C3_T13_0]|uniref:anti-sigma factor family protein n=1 Tax=Phaeobacter cretensis TaxID=3342641 RepID=UPI0039BC3234